MTLKNTLAVCAFLCSGFVFAQSKADKLYDNLSYAKALPMYQAAYKADNTNNHALRRAAACFYHMNKPEKAEELYAKVVEFEDVTPGELYNYTWALKSNQKYDQAHKWMKKFYAASSDDSRATKHITRQASFSKIIKDDGRFTVKNAAINSKQADFSPAFIGADSLGEIAFVSARSKARLVSITHTWDHSPYLNIYKADNDQVGGLSNISSVSGKANTKFHEGPLTFTKDGKRVFFTRNNYKDKIRGTDAKGITRLKIYMAEVDDQGNWLEEKEFPFNSEDYSVGHPTLSKDGLTLYFASDMPGSIGGADIYKTTLSGGSWSKPENLGNKINTEGNELFPFITNNGDLMLASNGHVGMGGLDLFMASKVGNAFAEPKNLGGSINSSKDDFGIIVASDNRSGYFSSNRDGGKGKDDIYSFEGELIKTVALKGLAKDAQTGNLLPGAKVLLLDKDGNIIAEQIVGEDAGFLFRVLPGEKYTLKTEKLDYDQAELLIEIPEDASGEIEKNIELSVPAVRLLGTIVSKDFKTPIQNAKVDVVDNATGKVLYAFNTPGDGTFSSITNYKKDDVLNWFVSVSAIGYLSKSEVLQKTIGDEKEIDITKELDLALNKIDVGSDIGKIIDINPIYFDVNKANIRPDAALELDKIVRVMKENKNIVIELGSHTDCRGSAAYNRKLSDRRAKSSAKYVKERLDDPSRISGKGYGESRLVNDCACEGAKKSNCSDAEHQLNRRTEFKIVRM